MSTPTPPVFIVDGSTYELVLSADDPISAAGKLEPPEVEAGELVAFDRFGYRANVGTLRWDVVIGGWSETPDPELLMRILAHYLESRGPLVGHTLDQLASQADALMQEEALSQTRPRALIPLLKWQKARRGK